MSLDYKTSIYVAVIVELIDFFCVQKLPHLFNFFLFFTIFAKPIYVDQ